MPSSMRNLFRTSKKSKSSSALSGDDSVAELSLSGHSIASEQGSVTKGGRRHSFAGEKKKRRSITRKASKVLGRSMRNLLAKNLKSSNKRLSASDSSLEASGLTAEISASSPSGSDAGSATDTSPTMTPPRERRLSEAAIVEEPVEELQVVPFKTAEEVRDAILDMDSSVPELLSGSEHSDSAPAVDVIEGKIGEVLDAIGGSNPEPVPLVAEAASVPLPEDDEDVAPVQEEAPAVPTVNEAAAVPLPEDEDLNELKTLLQEANVATEAEAETAAATEEVASSMEQPVLAVIEEHEEELQEEADKDESETEDSEETETASVPEEATMTAGKARDSILVAKADGVANAVDEDVSYFSKTRTALVGVAVVAVAGLVATRRF